MEPVPYFLILDQERLEGWDPESLVSNPVQLFDPWIRDEEKAFFLANPGSRIQNTYIWELNYNFSGKKYYNY